METGGCPHTAIREDASINLEAVDQLNRRFPGLELILVESGGDNLSATFSPELSDLTLYVIDVSAGDKIPRKGGPGICKSDLLVINKIDLAPLVGASLDVMDRDARAHARRQAVRVQQPEDRPGAGRNHRLHRAPGPADRRLTPLRNDKEPPMKLPKLLAALALLAAPALAFAHPGHGEHGLVAGLAHPLTGLDHLLAMFAVGLWAAQQQGAARLALPCTFVGTMLVGGLLGFEGLQLPFMETGIAASVLALGLCVALAVRPPLPLAMAATALFALAHGVAHGLELPASPAPGCTRSVSSPPPPRCTPPATRWCASCRRRPRPGTSRRAGLGGRRGLVAGRLSRRASLSA